MYAPRPTMQFLPTTASSRTWARCQMELPDPSVAESATSADGTTRTSDGNDKGVTAPALESDPGIRSQDLLIALCKNSRYDGPPARRPPAQARRRNLGGDSALQRSDGDRVGHRRRS